MKKDWEPSVLMALGAGLIVALIVILFLQAGAISELKVRVDFLEDTMETGLTNLEEKTDQVIYLIGLVEYEEARASAKD